MVPIFPVTAGDQAEHTMVNIISMLVKIGVILFVYLIFYFIEVIRTAIKTPNISTAKSISVINGGDFK